MSLLFAINKQRFNLPAQEVDPSVSLNDFIRRNTSFPGTKLSCGEGGCGACVVDIEKVDPQTGETIHMSVNSCLRPLASMDGCSVTTTEGLGGPKKGYHPIQERIANMNGLQCGFCTPGMVMSAYSNLTQTKGDITMEKMEKVFDGNICRCTGYRPILDACKSLAKDTDIEDLISNKPCPSFNFTEEKTFPSFLANRKTKAVSYEKDGKSWVVPNDLNEAFTLMSDSSRFVVANTSLGIYKDDESSLLIDLAHIPELLEFSQSKESITLGASLSISRLIQELEKAKANFGGNSSQSLFLTALKTHAERIANVHVRNVGSIGGNLSMAKSQGFVSDLATILLGCETMLTMQSAKGTRTITMEEFLENPEWNGEIIRSITIPMIKENQKYNSYKTAIRPLNSHALLNAAFLATMNESVIEKIVIAYGGVQLFDKVGSHAVLAKKTQEYLQGKELSSTTLKEALQILENEMVMEGNNKKEFRKELLSGFFYKFFLSLMPSLPENLLSTPVDLFKSRPVSKGSQKYNYPKDETPVSMAISKTSGPSLAAGNAKFIDDLPCDNDCVFGAFVTSTKANANVENMDFTDALQSPGVIDFVTADDIPGINNCTGFPEVYPFFANETVEYHGQPMAMIVADTLRHAEAAAKKVHVTYSQVKKPILSTEQAKENNVDASLNEKLCNEEEIEAKLNQSEKRVSGNIYMGSQQHFYMETQTSDAFVDEDNTLVIRSAIQWPGMVHSQVAKALDIPQSKVRLILRRAGGGFGGKITHSFIVSCATAVAAFKTQRRVRVALNRNVDMRLAGGREETTAFYDVGFTNEGKITALKLSSDLASGCKNDLSWFCAKSFVGAVSQAYDLPSFSIDTNLYKTNQAPRTAVRGPSEISASWCMETILEHIAHATNISVDEIRLLNFYDLKEIEAGNKTLPSGTPLEDFTLPKIFKQLEESANEKQLRQSVDEFNKANKWKKRGMAKTPVRYQVSVFPRSALLNVYPDGSIVVHHSTADIGQGAHIKVFQVISQRLGSLFNPPQPIDISLIRSGELDSNISPNSIFTGGSTSSESSCEAAQLACDQLLERLTPIVTDIMEKKKESGEESISWLDVCQDAAVKYVNLSAVGYVQGGRTYQNYGGCLSVVELDSITGEVEILESHLLYDCGKSLNPAIDIGQAEGAFVMGLGFLLREEVTYEEDGKLVNDGTWEYKPPCYRDIPQVFNVELLTDTPFKKGYLSSKASGEPPLVLANSVGFALRQAIKETRKENGLGDEFFVLNTPITVDAIKAACGKVNFDV